MMMYLICQGKQWFAGEMGSCIVVVWCEAGLVALEKRATVFLMFLTLGG
jgi:hypothetical protein